MANIYVYSGAAGTATGADWTNACTTLAAGITASAAGDAIWVAHDHAESSGSGKTHSFKGSAAITMTCIAVNRAGSVPPVAADMVATPTASITTTGGAAISNGMSSSSRQGYVWGIQFNCGGAGFNPALTLQGSGVLNYENCGFLPGSTNAGQNVLIGGSAANARATYIDCLWTFNFASHRLQTGTGRTVIRGGSVAASATVPTSLFTSSSTNAGVTLFEGVNLSGIGSGKTLIDDIQSAHLFQFRNCRLGTSVTVAAVPTVIGTQRTEVQTSDSTTGSSRQEIYDFAGTQTTETTIVRTSGASDGTTPISWKVVTTANAKITAPFECFETAIFNATTGSSKTVTVEIVNDGTTLTNAEAWIEVEYLGSSSYPLATLLSSRAATVLTTGANLSTSSVTWTTTGLASPVKQYMSATFTPQMVGLVRVRVYIARASKTVYVDPKLTVT